MYKTIMLHKCKVFHGKMTNLFNDFNTASKHQLKISVPRYKSEIIRPKDLEFFQLAVEIFQSYHPCI
jgi:hypothetical protein